MSIARAIRTGRAFVELFADDSKLVRGLRRAEKKLKAFGARVGAMGRKIATLGAAAAAPLALSTKVFAGFDDQMRAVQAVLGATGTDLAEATNIAGNTLRSFGLAAEDMGHVADVMTATANNSAQTLTDLGEAMKYAAPVADAYGLSIEQTSKALGALANFGIKGSMAGTTMKNIMLQLANPSIRKQIEGLGVSVTDAAGNFRDVGSILSGLGTAMKNLPRPKRLEIMNTLFGKRAVAGGIKLTTANFEKLNKAIDNANGTAQKTATTMDAGIGGTMRRLWSAVEGVAIAIGALFGPTVSRGTLASLLGALGHLHLPTLLFLFFRHQRNKHPVGPGDHRLVRAVGGREGRGQCTALLHRQNRTALGLHQLTNRSAFAAFIAAATSATNVSKSSANAAFNSSRVIFLSSMTQTPFD